MPDARGRVDDALSEPTVVRSQQPLAGEERHLRVVGDRTCAAVRRRKGGYPVWSEASADLGEAEEFDRRAECVAERASQQAPGDAFLKVELGHRGIVRAVETRSPLRKVPASQEG